MKIRAITLSNIRRFTEPARVGPVADGLNVLCEPNEHGKSTLFDAIQALFFKPHGSRDKEVTALRPHAGGAPEVSIEVETEEGSFTLTKRWLQKPMASVHRGATLLAQSDEAEAWIARLLGGDAGGPSGLIWVRQGMTDLTAGSKREQDAALEARRDLMTSVGAEVEAMTGGRRMDKALARCREELAVYATGTRRPKANGPWKEAQDTVEALRAERDALAATARDLQEALAERKRARRALRDLEAPEAAEERRKRLEAARAAHAAAERHAQELEGEARKAELARLAEETARSRLEAFAAARAEKAEAETLCQAAQARAEAARGALERQRQSREAADEALQAAEARLKAAQHDRLLALRAKEARDGAQRRAELADRISRAEAARAQVEASAAAARHGPDAAALRRIEALAMDHATAVAARNAAAPQVVARYGPGREGAIRMGETVLAEGTALPLTRRTRLDLDGIGALEILPGEAGADDRSVEAAAQALDQALQAVGADTLEAAREAAAARTEAAQRQGEAAAVLASLAPEGIDALRAARAAIPEAASEEDAPDLATAEAALDAAQGAYEAARQARDSASERQGDLRDSASRAEVALSAERDRLSRAETALARFGSDTPEALAAEATRTAEAHAQARAAQAEKARIAPDLAATQAALARAQSVETQAREEIARLKPLLARLDERIGRSSGDAVEERLAEATQELEAAEASLARIEHEVAVLARLEQALETARNEARERYFEPIAKELKPLLHLLWPEAELTWGEESLLPDSLVRAGQSERIDVLSGGTQEQIALLVRLAFARMLAAAGRIAPVILDDALVYTDDDRIERMFDALHRQAGDLQIIVLTCRQRAFRDLGGKALRLESLPEGGMARTG